MKTLYMVRHAKSSWKHDVIDHQRPLKGRGMRDGMLMTKALIGTVEPPQRIVSSDATRALSTAIFFRDAFQLEDAHFSTNNELYDFSGHNVMKVIQEFDNGLDSIMIVGHNHAFTSIANMLGNTYIENLPTCGFVQIEFDTNDWNSISTGKTVKTLFPRDLK